ncbi:MAG TPA: metalloregulator ArsR/SmtB family transcription factor [Kofleriaceae bacterium]|nr:metalloregulator ArsR/SmtB family transcription factor [Kofleriaceae bacterium]
MQSTDVQTDLSMVFSALADPTRRAILARLAAGEAPVKDLAEPFALSGPAITKHLKVLERAGLISRSRDGQQRPCRLEPRGLEPAADWLESYRAMWEERLDRLDAYLKSIARQPAATATAPSTTPSTAPSTATTKKTARKKPKPRTGKRERHGLKK